MPSSTTISMDRREIEDFKKQMAATKIILKIAATFLCVFASQVSAEDSSIDIVPVCDEATKLCGYADVATGDIVVLNQFERADPFSEGLAAVRVNSKFGFINQQGEFVVEPIFDLAGKFDQGLAEVLIGSGVGAIDQAGNLVVPPRFSRAIPFTSDTLMVAEGEWEGGEVKGTERLLTIDENGLFAGTRLGIYHMDSGWVTEPVFFFEKFATPDLGLVWATQESRRTGPFGILNTEGNWVTEPTFRSVSSARDGRAIVVSVGGNARWGAVDLAGTLVVPMAYDHLTGWSNGYSVVTAGERMGLLSPTGHLLNEKFYEKARSVGQNGLPQVMVDGSWFDVTVEGTLQGYEEDWVVSSCSSGLTIRTRAGIAEISHSAHADPIPYEFDDTFVGVPECSMPISVRYKGYWGFITQEGKLIGDPPYFESQRPFKFGYAPVKIDGAWGVVNLAGEIVESPIHSDVVLAEGHFILTSPDGEELILEIPRK